MAQSEVSSIIEKLTKHSISVFEIPDIYENNPEIVSFERNTGLRITGRRGFDIITDSFFVEEELCGTDNNGNPHNRPLSFSFEDFSSYYDFLNGSIYENACYAFHHISESELKTRGINTDYLLARKAFVEDTIDDHSLVASENEKEQYLQAKMIHKLCLKWINRFNACKNCSDFINAIKSFRKTKLAKSIELEFFFFNYVFADVNDKERFNTIMEYLSSGAYLEQRIIRALCSIYDPDSVLQSFHYSSGSKQTRYRHNKAVKDYILFLKTEDKSYSTTSFFDERTHFFCEKTEVFDKAYPDYPMSEIYRYFDSFEAFVDYRGGDLTRCNLSSAIDLKADFSKYKTDKTTILPVSSNVELSYDLKKYYKNGKFYVLQKWLDHNGNTIKEYSNCFSYFFDFVAFLRGDLSNSDLLFCDGLKNLRDWNGIVFQGAKLKSTLCEKFGLSYEFYSIDPYYTSSFDMANKNEMEADLVLESTRDLVDAKYSQGLTESDLVLDRKTQRVHYISDLHLMHRLLHANCRSIEDVIYTVQKIVNTIAKETGRLLLIAGDVASGFSLFQMFVDLLYKALHRSTLVVFTLGNHELWDFPGFSLDEIVKKYRSLLAGYGMYLLHNDVLFREDSGFFDDAQQGTHLLSYDELGKMEESQIAVRMKSSRYVILGGIGFSGYNTEFNANNGIYLNVLDRNTEIKESCKFEDLYLRLKPILSRKNTLIVTHTPKEDWCETPTADESFVYINGHTHRNCFYDDGVYRIYSDNQVGYHNESPHLKSLLIDNEYDCFESYSDGIFEIAREQYVDFYRGKNINMTFNREIHILHMLKKNGYYCFIHESEAGALAILNGGAEKRIPVDDIEHIFENMEDMISLMKNPLDKYSAFQRQIADAIKQFGGHGTIHGCIVDIDFFNHIYVNPVDLTVTGYWAYDMIKKEVYPSIPMLLEENCPELYNRYISLLQNDVEFPLAIRQQSDIAKKPQVYLSTDIYQASREIRKLQKLNSKILTYWYETRLKLPKRIDLV